MHGLVTAFGGSVRSPFEGISDEAWLANYGAQSAWHDQGPARSVALAVRRPLRRAAGSRIVMLGAASGPAAFARLYPRLSNCAITRAWCGFRPATPNGHPLVGTVDGCSSYVIAGGHGGNGVALAPITGRNVADLIKRDGAGPKFGAYAKSLAERDANDAAH